MYAATKREYHATWRYFRDISTAACMAAQDSAWHAWNMSRLLKLAQKGACAASALTCACCMAKLGDTTLDSIVGNLTHSDFLLYRFRNLLIGWISFSRRHTLLWYALASRILLCNEAGLPAPSPSSCEYGRHRHTSRILFLALRLRILRRRRAWATRTLTHSMHG